MEKTNILNINERNQAGNRKIERYVGNVWKYWKKQEYPYNYSWDKDD